MGEIRFVGTGETRGYPYLVCKNIVWAHVLFFFLFNSYNPKLLSTENVLKISSPEVIKRFSCSTQLSMNFFLFIDI